MRPFFGPFYKFEEKNTQNQDKHFFLKKTVTFKRKHFRIYVVIYRF